MGNQIITTIGFAIMWCVKYLFIPFGIAVFARLLADRLSRPHLKDKEKNDLVKIA